MIEFLGGPLDGAVREDLVAVKPILIVRSNGQSLVYKKKCCDTCSDARQSVPFLFVGYEDTESQLERSA